MFNSNSAFVIENILSLDNELEYSWYELIDFNSRDLLKSIKETITRYFDSKMSNLFSEIIQKRNRIVHGFQITESDGEQRLATKDKKGRQFIITEDYLIKFIKLNENISDILHEIRGL